MESKLCENCGNEFFRRENEKPGRWARRKLCGRACSGFKPGYIKTAEHIKNHAKSLTGYTHSEETKDRMRESRAGHETEFVLPQSSNCAECGEPFKPTGTRQRFCLKHGATSRDKERPPGTTTRQRNCKFCQTSFIPRARTQQYCSPQCKYDDKPHLPFPDTQGYIHVWVGYDYPGNSRGRMKEHRYIMQEYLGRPLTSTETVHHLNGDRKDNRIENLEFRVGQHGKGATHHCPTCTCHSMSLGSY